MNKYNYEHNFKFKLKKAQLKINVANCNIGKVYIVNVKSFI